ncbi:MAG: hypothetical protein QME58_13905 [Bacteroidota bacterium]|nr:hypothetical protein [Bacteroidota bacterium]
MERFDKGLDGIQNELKKIRIEIATLKTKATIWGAISAIVFSGTINFIIHLLKR